MKRWAPFRQTRIKEILNVSGGVIGRQQSTERRRRFSVHVWVSHETHSRNRRHFRDCRRRCTHVRVRFSLAESYSLQSLPTLTFNCTAIFFYLKKTNSTNYIHVWWYTLLHQSASCNMRLTNGTFKCGMR